MFNQFILTVNPSTEQIESHQKGFFEDNNNLVLLEWWGKLHDKYPHMNKKSLKDKWHAAIQDIYTDVLKDESNPTNSIDRLLRPMILGINQVKQDYYRSDRESTHFQMFDRLVNLFQQRRKSGSTDELNTQIKETINEILASTNSFQNKFSLEWGYLHSPLNKMVEWHNRLQPTINKEQTGNLAEENTRLKKETEGLKLQRIATTSTDHSSVSFPQP